MSDFEKMLRSMFSSIWDCEIDHPLWQDTVGEIMTAVIQAHEKCMPEPYGDAVSRKAAIDALQKCRKHCIDPFDSYHIDIQDAENQLVKLPSVQPEPSIPLSWIEGYIEQLRNTHGIYSALRVSIIDTMIDEWNKEQENNKCRN